MVSHKASQILALFILVTAYYTSYAQEIISLKVQSTEFFNPGDEQPINENDTIAFIVYTDKNCLPCFKDACTYAQEKLKVNKAYGLEFGVKNKYDALMRQETHRDYMPCIHGSYFILNHDQAQDKIILKLSHTPSPYIILKKRDEYLIYSNKEITSYTH